MQRDTDLDSCELPTIEDDEQISHTFLVIYRPDSQVHVGICTSLCLAIIVIRTPSVIHACNRVSMRACLHGCE